MVTVFIIAPWKYQCHCETSDRCHWLWQSVLLVQRATARVAPTEGLPIGFRRGRCKTSPRVRYKGCGVRRDTWVPPYITLFCRAGPVCPAVGAGKNRFGLSGKSAKRRQWRMKRAGFEEVPRLAGTTVPGNRSAQRWAREPLPYAPQDTLP